MLLCELCAHCSHVQRKYIQQTLRYSLRNTLNFEVHHETKRPPIAYTYSMTESVLLERILRIKTVVLVFPSCQMATACVMLATCCRLSNFVAFSSRVHKENKRCLTALCLSTNSLFEVYLVTLQFSKQCRGSYILLYPSHVLSLLNWSLYALLSTSFHMVNDMAIIILSKHNNMALIV